MKSDARPVFGVRVSREVTKFLPFFLEKCDPSTSQGAIVERALIDLMRHAPNVIEEIKKEQGFEHPSWLPTGPRKQLPYGLTAPIPTTNKKAK